MAWIESHQEMARHPKTRRVAVRLGISKAAVIGHLHLLWWWTLDFAPDGDLSGFEAEEIASVAEWEGDAEQFLQALLDTGWLDEGRRVHNWEDYAGRIVSLREDNRERQRRCREKKRDAVPPGGDDVAGVPRAGRTNVVAKSQACRPDIPEKFQTRNGGIKVASPLRNADVTAMSQLCHADVTVTSQLRHGATEPDQTEQNRTEPNRERVARGRAGGPAERSGGVPSLSRSRELVGVGEPAASGGKPLREAESVPMERQASGEGGRPAQEAGDSRCEVGEGWPRDEEGWREGEEPFADGGAALPPDLGRREGAEPGRGNARVAPRGEEPPLGESHALLRTGEESLPDEGPVGVDSSPEGPGVNSSPAGSFDAGRLSLEEGESPGGESAAGRPLDHRMPRLANGGDAPPMGDEAREALRQDAAFREAWRGWRLHLADLGRAVMSRGQERALLRECARRGPARAVEVIAYSITKGAKNLIWDDAPRAKRPPQSAGAKARVPNPEGWPQWLAAEYPDRAGIDYADAPESVQAEFRRAARKTG